MSVREKKCSPNPSSWVCLRLANACPPPFLHSSLLPNSTRGRENQAAEEWNFVPSICSSTCSNRRLTVKDHPSFFFFLHEAATTWIGGLQSYNYFFFFWENFFSNVSYSHPSFYNLSVINLLSLSLWEGLDKLCGLPHPHLSPTCLVQGIKIFSFLSLSVDWYSKFSFCCAKEQFKKTVRLFPSLFWNRTLDSKLFQMILE